MLSALGLASAATYGSYDRRDAKVVELDVDKLVDQLGSLLQSRDADPFLEEDTLYDDLIARDAYAYAEADPYAYAYPEADPDADPEAFYDESEPLELREADVDALEQWLHTRAVFDQAWNKGTKTMSSVSAAEWDDKKPSYANGRLHRRDVDDQVSGPRLFPRTAKLQMNPSDRPSQDPPAQPLQDPPAQPLQGTPVQTRPRKRPHLPYDGNGRQTSSQESNSFGEHGGKGPIVSDIQKSFSNLNQLAGSLDRGPTSSGMGAWGGGSAARKSYSPGSRDNRLGGGFGGAIDIRM